MQYHTRYFVINRKKSFLIENQFCSVLCFQLSQFIRCKTAVHHSSIFHNSLELHRSFNFSYPAVHTAAHVCLIFCHNKRRVFPGLQMTAKELTHCLGHPQRHTIGITAMNTVHVCNFHNLYGRISKLKKWAQQQLIGIPFWDVIFFPIFLSFYMLHINSMKTLFHIQSAMTILYRKLQAICSPIKVCHPSERIIFECSVILTACTPTLCLFVYTLIPISCCKRNENDIDHHFYEL